MLLVTFWVSLTSPSYIAMFPFFPGSVNSIFPHLKHKSLSLFPRLDSNSSSFSLFFLFESNCSPLFPGSIPVFVGEIHIFPSQFSIDHHFHWVLFLGISFTYFHPHIFARLDPKFFRPRLGETENRRTGVSCPGFVGFWWKFSHIDAFLNSVSVFPKKHWDVLGGSYRFPRKSHGFERPMKNHNGCGFPMVFPLANPHGTSHAQGTTCPSFVPMPRFPSCLRPVDLRRRSGPPGAGVGEHQ